MPTESQLRAALRNRASVANTAGARTLDADEVIRKARGRRRPRTLAFAATAALTVAGFAYVGITTIPWPQSVPQSASDTMADATAGSELALPETPPGATDPMAGGDPWATSINRCGQPLVEAGPTASGLVLTPDFPATGASNGLPIEGTVTLTNTGKERVTGLTSAEPIVVLSLGGITVWHTHDTTRSIGYPVDLAPGESQEFAASFTPVQCTQDGEDLPTLPGDLPPLGPGTYRVTTYLDLRPLGTREPGDPGELVGGPAGAFAITGG